MNVLLLLIVPSSPPYCYSSSVLPPLISPFFSHISHILLPSLFHPTENLFSLYDPFLWFYNLRLHIYLREKHLLFACLSLGYITLIINHIPYIYMYIYDKCLDFISLYEWIKFHCVHELHFLYPLIYWGTPRMIYFLEILKRAETIKDEHISAIGHKVLWVYA